MSQKIPPRLNQSVLYEPQNKIIKGAVQVLASCLKYCNVLLTRNITYPGLREAISDQIDGLYADLISNPGKFQVAHIELSMTMDGTQTANYEQGVASVLYDKQIEIFMMGTEVATLVNEKKPGGEFSIEWNAAGLVNGIYFCKLQKGKLSDAKKMLILK